MSFGYPDVSVVAILAGAVFQFVLGFAWYSPMTPIGKRWAMETGLADAPGKPGAEMGIFPVSALLAAWATAMVLGWSGAESAMDGVKAGLVIATAVSAQVLAGLVASTTRSVMLAAIHVGYVVIGYGIMGAIIGVLS